VNYLNMLVNRVKGDSFTIDSRVQLRYLLRFSLGKLFTMLYGRLLFPFGKRCFVHPSSVIKYRRGLLFGKNFRVDRWCHIDALSVEGIRLGENVSVGKYTTIECTGSLMHLGKGLAAGNNVGLGSRCHYGCAGGVEIGDDTIVGNYSSFHSENHNFSDPDTPIRKQGVNHKGIKVGAGCWIGAKATFLDGSSVGDGCVVAAGSVVRGNFEDGSIIGGVPAKVIGMRPGYVKIV